MTQRRSKLDPLSPVSLTGKEVHRRPPEYGDSREAVKRLQAAKRAVAPAPPSQEEAEETYSDEQLRKRRELAALLWGDPEEGAGDLVPSPKSQPGVSIDAAADELVASADDIPVLEPQTEEPREEKEKPERAAEESGEPQHRESSPPPLESLQPDTAQAPDGGPPLGAAETDPGNLRFERDFAFDDTGEIKRPSSPKIPKNLISAPPVQKPVGAKPTRAVKRRECAFPGLVRIMVPELSFQARVLAIRMVDVSPLGAKIETRQMTKDFCDVLDSKHHFCSLEVLVPNHDRVVLKGQVAWAEHGPETGFLGVKFTETFHNVDDIFSQMLSERSTGVEKLTLTSPRIERFPAMTAKEKYTFRGQAPRAAEVVVRQGKDEIRTPVVGGRFEVEVSLMPECSNFLSFISEHDKHRSIPTPVCIVHRTGTRDTMTFSPSSLVQEMILDEDEERIFVRMSGEPRRYFQALRVLERALEHAEQVSMSVEIKGNTEKLHEAVKRLEKEK